MATVTQGGLNELYVENGNGHLRGSKWTIFRNVNGYSMV